MANNMILESIMKTEMKINKNNSCLLTLNPALNTGSNIFELMFFITAKIHAVLVLIKFFVVLV